MAELIFFDGEDTPTFRQADACGWRPPKGDTSWRIEDEATRKLIAEYHPPKARHAWRASQWNHHVAKSD